MTTRWRWGAAALAAYGAAALGLGLSGARLLPVFDGVAPVAPYRWVNPPPEMAQGNQPPESGEQVIEADADVKALAAFTLDAQASMTAADPAFGEHPDERSVRVTVRPLDPETLGPPPEGLGYQGNAYEFAATFQPSGEPARLEQVATVVLRYPIHATTVLRKVDGGWERLPKPITVGESLTIYAETPEMGTFVAAGPPTEEEKAGVLRWVGYGAAGLALVGAVALALIRRRRASAARR
ncbi:MAG TPA: hypothetical protein VM638_08865, partial [Actinomycetota bacterium]|nr:hypothetical protein [Actinomycetota bacterium]